LQSGDVVLEFDGTSISKPGDLQGRVERASLNDVHKVEIIRDGKTMSINVRVEAMPSSVSADEPKKVEKPVESDFNSLGLQLSELTADVAKQLGVDELTGVIITNVKSRSPSDNAGLEAGMVIKKVGQKVILSVKDFQTAMKDASPKEGVLLLIQVGEVTRFVVVKV